MKSTKFNFLGFKIVLGNDGYSLYLAIARSGGLFLYKVFDRPRIFLRKQIFKIEEAIRYLQIWPVYFEIFSRDCDLCERTQARKYWCYWVAMRDLYEEADGWDEGPFNFRQISKREYLNFEPTFRDRIGEAFDDGKGTRVIL